MYCRSLLLSISLLCTTASARPLVKNDVGQLEEHQGWYAITAGKEVVIDPWMLGPGLKRIWEYLRLLPTAGMPESEAVELAKKRAQFLYGKEAGFKGATDKVVTVDDGKKVLYLNTAPDGDCCFHATKWPRDTAVADLSKYIDESEAEMQHVGLSSLEKYHEFYDKRSKVVGVWDGPIVSLQRDGVKTARKQFFELGGVFNKHSGLKGQIDTVIGYLTSDVAEQASLKAQNKAVFDFIEAERGKSQIDWMEIERRIAEIKTVLSGQKILKIKSEGKGKGTLSNASHESSYNKMDIALTALMTASNVEGLFNAKGILEKSSGEYIKLTQTKQWLEERSALDQVGRDNVLQVVRDALDFLEGEKSKTEPNWTEIEAKLRGAYTAVSAVPDKAFTPMVVDYVRYLESFGAVLKDSVSISKDYWDNLRTFMIITPNRDVSGKMLMEDHESITISDIGPYLGDLNKQLTAAGQKALSGIQVKRFNFYLAFSNASREDKKKLLRDFYGSSGQREWMDLGPIAHISPRFGLKYKVYRQESGVYKEVQASVNADEVDGVPLRRVFHTGGHYDMLGNISPDEVEINNMKLYFSGF